MVSKWDKFSIHPKASYGKRASVIGVKRGGAAAQAGA
jgi:hypothetical protein